MDDYIDEALKKRGYDAFRIHKMREKYSDAVLRKEFDIAKPKNVKDSEAIEKMILEATKKPPGNESYSDKQKRMNKRDKLRRAAMETQNPSWEKRKALMKKVFETMKAKHTSKQSSGSLTETKAMEPKSRDKPKEKSWKNMTAEERKKHDEEIAEAARKRFQEGLKKAEAESKEYEKKAKKRKERERDRELKQAQRMRDRIKGRKPVERIQNCMNDERFLTRLRVFMASDSIYDNLIHREDFAIIYKGIMMVMDIMGIKDEEEQQKFLDEVLTYDTRNDQQKVYYRDAWGAFTDEYPQYSLLYEYSMAFDKLILETHEFPNNFFATYEEWDAHIKKVMDKIKAIADTNKERIIYERLKRMLYEWWNEHKKIEMDTSHLVRDYGPKAITMEKANEQSESKHELSHDLVKDAKEYRNKHMDELRTIQSNLSIDQRTRRNGFGNDSGTHLVLKPLVDIVMKFIQNKGYTIDDTEAILTTIGFDVESRNIRLIKEALANKQANKQATPPTPTSKPKLNLFNIQQSNPPVSIPPSMTIKPRASLSISSPQTSESKAQDNPNLKRSKFSHIGRDNKIDYSFGVVKGVESDNRIYNDELKPYYKALKRLQDADMLNQLKSKTGIHSTNRVRSAVSSLIPGRLTGWR